MGTAAPAVRRPGFIRVRLLLTRIPGEIKFRERFKFFLTNYTVRYIVYAIHYMSHGIENNDQRFENLRQELRRGSLPLAVLAALRREHYGYTLRKALAEHGMAIDEGTLYPLLRRLEAQGLLVSQWREEDKRNKRFYRLSPEGKLILKQLLIEWKGIHASLEDIF